MYTLTDWNLFGLRFPRFIFSSILSFFLLDGVGCGLGRGRGPDNEQIVSMETWQPRPLYFKDPNLS